MTTQRAVDLEVAISAGYFDDYDSFHLVGVQWTSVYPTGDVIQPNNTLPFELTVYLDPELDDDFTFVTIVQGYPK